MKKVLKFLSHRLVIVGVAIVAQAVLLIHFILKFNNYFVYFYAFSILLSLCVVLYIVNLNNNPGYKIAWIIPILLFPIFGGLVYLLFGGNRVSHYTQRRMRGMQERINAALRPGRQTLNRLEEISPTAANQSRYLSRVAHCPPYQGTATEYLPMGEIKFKRLLEALQSAKHYIFLEYFIIQEGVMWDSVLRILEQKAAEGLDVRLIYDDLGCIMTLPYRYYKRLEEKGIRCRVFNPFVPVLTSRINNRDHRKIAVIDGYIGFTGGINLADEYINAYEKHGHWKDSSILIRGDAVWSLTTMFLSMWDYITGEQDDYERFRPHIHMDTPLRDDGFVQPYCDNPLDDEAVGETVYLNLINKAERYVYITTPYLVIDNEMVTALCTAAKSGVDVRIITPHIPDKWYVHAVSRAYYEVLVKSGVQIYEYTPGFIHAKTFAVDDIYGTVGTINLDYRSLYLHFECGAWLYRAKSILHIREDFLKTLQVCEHITLEKCRNVKWYQRLGRAVLRAFAPLL